MSGRWSSSKRKIEYCERFGVDSSHESRPFKSLTEALMDQLDRCADDEARRLILGVKDDR